MRESGACRTVDGASADEVRYRAPAGCMKIHAATFAFALTTAACASRALASDIVDVRPLTDRILVVHFDDGSVRAHHVGQKRADERMDVSVLDTTAAARAASYTLSSKDDPAYAAAKPPTDVGRKSKGTEFAIMCQRYDPKLGCVNDAPDHAKEHWIYLMLPTPLHRGSGYVLSSGSLAKNGSSWPFKFDEQRMRSEAVHVNQIGYRPDARAKFGYVYHWMGDRGGLDLKPYEGATCRILSDPDRREVFAGKLAFRKPRNNRETGQSDTPDGNFVGADVYECDFSALQTPGAYVLEVDGIGSSFGFRIDSDVYRRPFYVTMKGLFLQRSGIALEARFADGFARPADHNPKLTPGFAGRLKYTTTRWFDVSSDDADPKDKGLWETGIKGNIDTWGWYQDAGDWDGYLHHSQVPALLMFLFEADPSRFADSELNLPESGNGIPDVLDEARWLIRFYHRTRHAILDAGYGSGGVGGARVMGDLWGGDEKPDGTTVGSWGDTHRMWIVSGEDPWTTYRYAALAAQFAWILHTLGKPDPEGIDWRAEAEQAYKWAAQHTLPGDETPKHGCDLVQFRMYAAVALYRLTRDPAYHRQFLADFAIAKFPPKARPLADQPGEGSIDGDSRYAVFLYAALAPDLHPDAAVQTRCLEAVAKRCAELLGETVEKRAMRWGGLYWMPLVTGQGSSPQVGDAAIGRAILAARQPDLALRYLSGLETTADYVLGTNPLNMTWVPRLGARYPTGIFRMDSWYGQKPGPTPGYVPYGPTGVRFGGAPPLGWWNSNWANHTVYPADIEQWPGHERWFEQRVAPMSCENTLDNTTLSSAIVFGALLGPATDIARHAASPTPTGRPESARPLATRCACELSRRSDSRHELWTLGFLAAIFRRRVRRR